MPKTTLQQLDEYTSWAMDEWDRVIDQALVEFGAGAKPTPQQKAANTRAVWELMRRTAARMDQAVGPDIPMPGG
mgnify:CR=1 FL=1